MTYRKKGEIVKSFCGAGVVPYADRYNFEVTAFGKLDFFALTTCHEEVTSERPDKGIWRKDGKVTVNYIPTIEKSLHCPLFVSAYNRKQRHAWGVIVFESPDYVLRATLECNGYSESVQGVSVCQSRHGLVQRITFKEPVKLVKPVGGASDRKTPCPVIGKDGDTVIQFPIPPRECMYGFIGLRTGQVHQLYTIGYEEIIIRE